jgi:hypothetical protein
MPHDVPIRDAEGSESAETFTERDVLLALAVRSLSSPEGFNAQQFQDELTALGFSSLLEEAQELIEIAEIEQSAEEGAEGEEEPDEKTIVNVRAAAE